MHSFTKQISLYFHIPFCTQKCDYCHFYVLPDKDSFKQQLMEGLQLEWQMLKPFYQDSQIASVYFGGGTPSLLGVDSIAKILSWIEQSCSFHPQIEITLEANPENISLPLMKGYANAGINRLSLGVQSFDANLLKVLHRIHTADRALQAIEEVYTSGIENISIDLMYDIPYQTLEQWEQTLEQAVLLPITHLSFYNLTIEPYTNFYKHRRELEKVVPDGEISLQMLRKGIEYLESHDFLRYEISAFAKNGFSSCHNLGYWTARPFLGLGPSAFSYWEGSRYQNIPHLGKYLNHLQNGKEPVGFRETLELEAHIRELLAVELRLVKGVELENFQARHGQISQKLHTIIAELSKEQFLTFREKTLFLTEKGRNFYDSVAAEIVSL